MRSVGPKACAGGVEVICDVEDPELGQIVLLGDAFRIRQCLLNIVGAWAAGRWGNEGETESGMLMKNE